MMKWKKIDESIKRKLTAPAIVLANDISEDIHKYVNARTVRKYRQVVKKSLPLAQ